MDLSLLCQNNEKQQEGSFQVGKEELVQFLMRDGVGEGTEKGTEEQGNHFFSPTHGGTGPGHHRSAFKKHVLVFHFLGGPLS